MRVQLIDVAKYFVTFTDNKSSWLEVCFLKTIREVENEILKFKAFVETQTEMENKILRTDNDWGTMVMIS